jgi:hypothetical protein
MAKLDRSRTRQYTRGSLPKDPSVTICVAALAGSSMIVAASDRTLTVSGIYTVKSPLAKWWKVTDTIIAMLSGDMDFQWEILQALQSDLNAGKPWPEWQVREVANLYRKHYDAACGRIAEQEILSKARLDFPALHRGRHLPASLVTNLTQKLDSMTYPDAGVLIVGRDATGHHICQVEDGNLVGRDASGHASTGIGARHADSTFALWEHGPVTPLADTLFITYLAKKRAEIAPMVGRDTDMFIIADQNAVDLHADVQTALEARYQAFKRQEDKAGQQARTRMQEWVDKFLQSLQQPPTPPVDGTAQGA